MMNLQEVLSSEFAPIEHAYTHKDTILYALGVAIGHVPVDPVQLKFVYEKGLTTLPSMCNVLAHPGLWVQDPKYDIDWKKALHGDQRFIVHKPLPAEGVVVGKLRVLGVEDKGADKGALLFYEKVLFDKTTGENFCTVQTTGFLRGDGGCGSSGETLPKIGPVPTHEPDVSLDLPTYPNSALMYRLSADLNPLHVDPEIAHSAGFERPILHGLCTMGVVCFGLIKMFCNGNPERLTAMGVRFSSPVYPGETVRIHGWRNNQELCFRASVVERDLVVLDRGIAVINHNADQ